MSLRITTQQNTAKLLEQLATTRFNLSRAQDQISSGQKVAKASDDAGRAGSITALQSTITRLERNKARMTFGTGLLNTQESALAEGNNLLVRCREIAEQAANGTQTPQTRSQLAQEVYEIREQMVALGNTSYLGLYVYGAADDDDPPFDASTYDVPADSSNPGNTRYIFDAETGTSTTRSIQINDGESVRVNSSGDGIFSEAIGSIEKLARALAGYKTTLDGNGIPDGTGDAYNFATEGDLQRTDILSAMDQIESVRVTKIGVERTSVGSRISRMEQVSNTLDSLIESTQTARAAIQDADPFQAATEFTTLQQSLQALLASGAQINQLSLLDYL